MRNPAYSNRQISAVTGLAANLNVQREFVKRPTAVGGLLLTFWIDVANSGAAPVDFDPFLCVSQIAATVTLNNGHAPVCVGHPLTELLVQSVLDKWTDNAGLADVTTLQAVPAGGNRAYDTVLFVPFANMRTPGVTPQGEIYGEHIQDFQFSAGNLMAGQDADLAIGAAGWNFTVFAIERPSNPFLGAARMFRRAGIADSTQVVGYGFLEDMILFGNLPVLETQNISIRRGVVTTVENSVCGIQSNVSLRSIRDPDYRPDNDVALVPICRGDNERLTHIPAGRVEIVNFSGAWPANTVMHTAVIQPMGLAVPGFLHKWQGAMPVVENEVGSMELITAKQKMGVAFNFMPITMKKAIG